MRRLIVPLIVGLVAASGAAAKAPPEGIEICGKAACKSIPQLQAERIVTMALYGSAAETPGPAPFFLVRWQWPERGEQRAWWVPKGGLVRNPSGAWVSQSVSSEAMLRSVAGGLQPFPTPVVTRVIVGRKLAENPQSYLRLLRGGSPAPASAFDRAKGWIPVRIASLDPSPWTNEATVVQVSRTGNWVWRDGRVCTLTKKLVERARLGLSLTPFSRPG